MKPTVKNLRAVAILRAELKRRPDFEPESTTQGKVHGGFGILCAFTSRDACEETLSAIGLVPTHPFGRFSCFTLWKRKGGVS